MTTETNAGADGYAAPARLACWSAGVWLFLALLGSLLCWSIVANDFALSGPVDEFISATLTRFASSNGLINHAILTASESTLLTGGFLMGLVWFCWFADRADHARERLMLGFAAVLIAAALSRLLQVSMPIRLRPLLATGFRPLPGIDSAALSHWGSFPSDHAALFFAMIAVVWQRSRWLGMLALVSALGGVLPRIFLGLHYFSDVVAGAMLGMTFVVVFERYGPAKLAHSAVAWEQRFPAFFYGTAFLLSLEVATLFEDVRALGRGVPAVLNQFGL